METLSLFDENDLIHSPDRIGYFSVLRKYPDRKPSQRSYVLSMLPEVLRALGDTPDCYISQGEFRRPNRRTVNLLRIGVCWVDLDYYKVVRDFRTPYHLVEAFLDHCNDVGLPLPSIMIDSGRGVYAKWILDRPVPAVALPRWNAVQRLLLARIEGFGEDSNAADASRVLRIMGTVNSKNGRPVSVLWENSVQLTYDFEDLATEVLPLSREEYRQKWRAENQKLTVKQQQLFKENEKRREVDRRVVRRLFNPYTLNWNRLVDLRKLVDLRAWESPPKGWQDNFLFKAACFLSWSIKPPRLHHEMEQLAFEFAPHWTIQEVRGVLSPTLKRAQQAADGEFIKHEDKLHDPRYRWSNLRLIEELAITPSEQCHMLTIIGKDEKNRRRREKDHDMTREEYESRSADRCSEARQLREQGLSIRKIATVMQISKSQVQRYL